MIANKATSAAILAITLGIIAFGVWIVTPSQVSAATNETNATTTSVTVNVYVACGMPDTYADGIDFGSLDPETNDNFAENGFKLTSPDTNNVNITYYIKANGDLTRQDGGEGFIKLGNYTWYDNGTVVGSENASLSTALTTSYAIFSADGQNIPPGGTDYMGLWLDVPIVPPGTYNNTIYIKCNQST
ncbi:MAG: hypothetical protein J7K87_03025 [Candidatus Aenigmarchaeota archaeon]|nr:hypothetical protein [Candidatus Aenigmarchaeota archaeon]